MTTTVFLVDANGNAVGMAVAQVPNGLAAAHVLCDGSGTPYGSANPLLTAPTIRAADFINRSGTITVVGAVALDIAANVARKGGYIRAPLANGGNLVLTLKGTGSPFITTLEPGGVFPMTVNPGYVLPHEISVTGTVVGDTFEAVEFV